MPRSRHWKKATARRAVLGRLSDEQHVEEESPVICQAQSPVICQAQSPVICQAQSPVICQAQSPVICQAKCENQNDYSEIKLPEKMQAEHRHGIKEIAKECSPAKHATENTSIANNTSNIEDSNLSHTFPLVNDSCFISKSANSELDLLNSSTVTSNFLDYSLLGYHANGPFKCKVLLYGSYSQNHSKFSVYSRGSQCTINSLCALIYSHYINLSSQSIIDEVLNVGDQLYQNVLYTLKQQGKFKHRLLSLEEIPDKVNLLRRQVHIIKDNITSGVAVGQLDNSSLPSLHQSLHTAFINAQYILVMIGAVCSAVFIKDGFFWVFDSHSHGKHGLSSPEGKAVLMSFTSLDDLVTFMSFCLSNLLSPVQQEAVSQMC